MDDTPGEFAFRTQVAAEVRAHLARHRITGRDLAVRLNCSQPWIARRLNATVAFDVDDLYRVAQVLNVRPAQLLPGDS